jgi:hypothetical protein
MDILLGNWRISNIATPELEDYRYFIDKEITNRMKDHYNKLYSAFDVIIDAASQTKKYVDFCYYDKHFFENKRTVQINSGRQSGKTCYIASRFDPNRDIIICHNMQWRNEFIRLLTGGSRDLNSGKTLIFELRECSLPISKARNRVFSKSDFETLHNACQNLTIFRGTSIRRVWIDECSLNSSLNLSVMYDTIASYASDDIVFVKMGE